MKKYNIPNYIRYKEDLKKSNELIKDKYWVDYTRNELIIKFMPLVENIARKFATSQQASGVLTINDLIQEGSLGLTAAVDKIDWDMLHASEDIEKTLKSFLSKRIKGSIRRAIDRCRGDCHGSEGDAKRLVAEKEQCEPSHPCPDGLAQVHGCRAHGHHCAPELWNLFEVQALSCRTVDAGKEAAH